MYLKHDNLTQNRRCQINRNKTRHYFFDEEFILTKLFYAFLKDGCISFPSLCTIKDELLWLMEEIKTKGTKLDEERKSNILKINLLKDVNSKNRHILHLINETEQTLILVINNSRSIDSQLEKHLSVLLDNGVQRSHLSKTNMDFYVDRIVEPLEYRLAGIKRLLSNRTLESPEVIVLEEMIGTSVKSLIYTTSQFFAMYDVTRSQINKIDLVEFLFKLFAKTTSITADEIEILKDIEHPGYTMTSKKYGLLTPKYKLAWKLVQTIANEVKSGIWHLSGNSVLEQANIWKLNGFQSNIQISMSASFIALKRKYHHVNVNLRHASENFKLTFRKTNWDDEHFRPSMSNTVTVITRSIRERLWNTAVVKMEEMKITYKAHLGQIRYELQGVLDERKKLLDLRKQCMEQYQDTVKPYVDFLSTPNINTFMGKVFELQISTTNVSVNFANRGNSNISNLLAQQEQTSTNLHHVKQGLDQLKFWSRAQSIVLGYVGMATEMNKAIMHMHETLQEVFAFQSIQVRKFGNGIEIAELLCIISLIRRDLDEYDGYSLKSIRGNCFIHNATTFTHEALKQYRKAIIQNKLINEVKQGKSEDPAVVLDAVIKMFITHVDSRLKSYGNFLSEKDILCTIAYLFPRKDTYGFYNLFHFRPNCSKMSNENFRKLKHAADKKRMEMDMENIKRELCKQQGLCSPFKPVVTRSPVDNNTVEYTDSILRENNSGARSQSCLYKIEYMTALFIFLLLYNLHLSISGCINFTLSFLIIRSIVYISTMFPLHVLSPFRGEGDCVLH